MSTLSICRACRRHVQGGETRCPFCRAAFVVLAASAAIACGGSRPEPAAAKVAADPPATATTSAASVPAPSATTDKPGAPAAESVAPHGTDATVAAGASAVPAYGAPPAPVAPPGRVDIGPPQVTGGTLPNLDAVMSSLRTSFNGCVAKARASRADLSGKVSVTIRVGLAGQVLGVAAQQTTNIPAPLVSCISTRAATVEFSPPQGAKGQVTVVVPLDVPKT
jgi:hypothetical protein